MTTHIKLLALALLLVALVACGRDKAADTTTAATPAGSPAATGSATTPDVTPVTADAPTPTTADAPEADAPTTDTPDADAPADDAAGADAPAAAPGDSEALAVVQNAMRAQASGGPYRATTTINSGGTVTEMTAEVVPPDQMHILIGGGNMELIMLESTLWSKTAGSPWVQMGSPDTMQSIFDAMRGQVDAANLTEVQKVGAEPVLGVATDVYTFKSSMGSGSGLITSDVKLWVAQETGLPVRMESSSVAGGVTTTALQTIEYDDTITIEAPAQ